MFPQFLLNLFQLLWEKRGVGLCLASKPCF